MYSVDGMVHLCVLNGNDHDNDFDVCKEGIKRPSFVISKSLPMMQPMC